MKTYWKDVTDSCRSLWSFCCDCEKWWANVSWPCTASKWVTLCGCIGRFRDLHHGSQASMTRDRRTHWLPEIQMNRNLPTWLLISWLNDSNHGEKVGSRARLEGVIKDFKEGERGAEVGGLLVLTLCWVADSIEHAAGIHSDVGARRTPYRHVGSLTAFNWRHCKQNPSLLWITPLNSEVFSEFTHFRSLNLNSDLIERAKICW